MRATGCLGREKIACCSGAVGAPGPAVIDRRYKKNYCTERMRQVLLRLMDCGCERGRRFTADRELGTAI